MIKCAVPLFIIATCIVGIFGDEFCEKQRKMDSECAKYCYQVAKPLLQMAPVCHQKDAEITDLIKKIANLQKELFCEQQEKKSLEEVKLYEDLNVKLADLQNKLFVYDERVRKSLEEENRYNELNDKFIKLREKLAVYEYRVKGFEEGNIELKTKIANLQNDLDFYKEGERKSLEEENKCNELNATLAELPTILLNLEEREKKGIEEMNKSKQFKVQLGEVQEKLADCEEREKKGIEEINSSKKLNVQLGEVQEKFADCEERENKGIEEMNKSKQFKVQLGDVQEKLADCEEREKKGIEEINLNKELNVQLGEVQEKFADCEEREKKGIEEMNKSKQFKLQLGEVQEKLADCKEREKNNKEINSKAESRFQASVEEYRVKFFELESSNLALNISNQKLKEDLKQFYIYSKYNNSCFKPWPGVDTIGTVDIKGMEAFPVQCVNDLSSGPGWMIIQEKTDKLFNIFYHQKNWAEYRNGFSDDDGHYFIGLEKLYRLTNAVPHELYIDMEDYNGNKKFAHYDNFRVGSESEQYPLKDLGNYNPDSNAGDALWYNNNMKFSTHDQDNDNSPDVDCAKEYWSGWWHNNCTIANLNGRRHRMGFVWWLSPEDPLKQVRMLIRPKVKK